MGLQMGKSRSKMGFGNFINNRRGGAKNGKCLYIDTHKELEAAHEGLRHDSGKGKKGGEKPPPS